MCLLFALWIQQFCVAKVLETALVLLCGPSLPDLIRLSFLECCVMSVFVLNIVCTESLQHVVCLTL